jgi:hypothetical protein
MRISHGVVLVFWSQYANTKTPKLAVLWRVRQTFFGDSRTSSKPTK